MKKAIRLTGAFVALFIGALIILAAAERARAQECMSHQTVIEKNLLSAKQYDAVLMHRTLDQAETKKFFEVAGSHGVNVASIDPLPDTMIIMIDSTAPIFARYIGFKADGCYMGAIIRMMPQTLAAMNEVVGTKEFKDLKFIVVKPGERGV